MTDEEAQEFAQNNIDSEDGALKVNLDTFIKVKNLTKRAIAEGLTENEAEAFAKRNVGSSDEQVENNLNKLLINNSKGIYEGQYKDGLSISTNGTSSSSSSNCTNGRCYAIREVLTTGKAIYNQPYSIITADTKSGTRNYSEVNELHNVGINGLKTKVDALPTEGTASYNGKAFDALNQGKLSYQVNFSNKTGSGNITGLGRDITLEQGSISGTSISATATQSYNSGNYTLDFFGKNAEEIGGKVSFDGKDVVGFGGTRGEIQK
ncbi:Slam-dependent surface lipoprotein [Rodentibacter pneumotropicus]|uniref:Slam-dependent surface lipoprotein n=1 Tax=Rodentibacter pneumotropicus TaxID=758 RepID=UPI001EE1B516|nr:Slam-dependent surface lipoprotein [Rodentibacter pneumotropicus]